MYLKDVHAMVEPKVTVAAFLSPFAEQRSGMYRHLTLLYPEVFASSCPFTGVYKLNCHLHVFRIRYE